MDINVEELLNNYGIDFNPKGESILVHCFFHDDKTPSFSINKAGGYFQCFSCKVHGNYGDLYQIVTGQKYKYSPLDTWVYNPVKRKKNKEEKKDIAIKIFGKLQDPMKNDDIRAWLYKYGVEKDSFIKDYEITYSPYTEMIADNLMDNPEIDYTKMVNRITLPIYSDSTGKVVNYEGRTYKDAQPKVLYVRGGVTDTLYNWANIDINKPVVVVEGIKAFWRVWNVYTNTVAMMHNIPTDNQIALLNSIKSEIILYLDHDHGGFGEYTDKGKLKRKGTIQYAEETITKDFKICYSPIWGYDPNDSSNSVNEKLIENARWYSKVKVDALFNAKKESW